MKKALITLYFVPAAFLVTVLFLITDPTPFSHQSVGNTSFAILHDTLTQEKFYFYTRQSLRHAAYAALLDLKQDGFFPLTNQRGEPCPLIQGKPLLFTDASCPLTKPSLEQRYLKQVQAHFSKAFKQPLYGLSLSSAEPSLQLTFNKEWMELSGSFPDPLTYKGDVAQYTFSLAYKERIPYGFQHYLALISTLKDNLACIQRLSKEPTLTSDKLFLEALRKQCIFSNAFTWEFKKQDQLLFITAMTTERVLFLDNLLFAFAITLNNLQIPREDTPIF